MRYENPQSKIRDSKSILAAVASSVDGQAMATIAEMQPRLMPIRIRKPWFAYSDAGECD